MSDPSDRPDEPRPAASELELEVDLGAFLPEGSVLAGSGDEDGIDTGWGDEGDEPEVPAWARDDEPVAPAPGADRPAPDPAAAPTPVAAPGPSVPTDPAPQPPGSAATPTPTVDVAVLAQIEGDLAAVDEALAAIDAGDPGRSALLVELVGPDLADRTEG